MRIYIDIWTGQLRKSADGGPIGPLVLTQNDKLALEVVFVDGAELKTSEVLADDALLKICLKSRPGASETLALASSYVLAGEIATLTLNLATDELDDYFTSALPSNASSAPLSFEVEVTSSDSETRQTYHQSTATVRREVNRDTDTAPALDTNLHFSQYYVAFRGEITARTGGTANALDAIATVSLNVPLTICIRLADTIEFWSLAAGSAAEDGVFVVRPDDYNASTNQRVWTRVL